MKKNKNKKNIEDEMHDFDSEIKIKWWEKRIYYPLWRKWRWFKNIPRELLWFIQRGKRGYADCDVWSLDGYLCSWLPSALRKLKKISHGYPDGDVKSMGEWKEILEKTSRGFEAVTKLDDAICSKKYNTKLEKSKRIKLQKEIDEGMKLFVKHFQSLWD